jgi:hypothetical protein
MERQHKLVRGPNPPATPAATPAEGFRLLLEYETPLPVVSRRWRLGCADRVHPSCEDDAAQAEFGQAFFDK